MTKEEALKILDTIPTIGEQVDALEMAIKALEEQPDKIIVAHNDKVIIEPTLYMKPQVLHNNVELILKQMETGDVTVLPPGFTAKIIRRDAVFGKCMKGETDDN